MCICLPNGKFNFKFSRSLSCTGKKGEKSKRPLSLISESSEDDDGRDKLSLTHRHSTKNDAFNTAQCESANNQGKLRQLARDRQLPPVPDALDFGALQLNSPRKNAVKNNSMAGKGDLFNLRQDTDDYGHIYDSEPYAESKNTSQHLLNKQNGMFPMTLSEDIREIDPLYSSVLLQSNRQRSQVPGLETNHIAKDYYCTKNDDDHLYSTIVKKDFNSLRKPSKPRPSVRDYPHQSLQSLTNQAPGLPVRLYKLSELAHLTNHVYPDVKLRNCTPLNSLSSSIRRFSQPNSIHNENDHESQISEEGQRDIDVLRRIQSQYNTPPIKRASLSDLRQLHVDIEEPPIQCHRASGQESGIAPSPGCASRTSDTCDLYRHITVRESLASLRARKALPENDLLFDNGSNVESHILPRVYEGLYETLYYSSADPGRPGPSREQDLPPPQAMIPDPPNPLPYLSHDNYLSITENHVSNNYHSQNCAATTNNGIGRQSLDRNSVIYATTGSEVYAEISDAYLSKQYEELPDPKQISKENGQVNNGYVGSPGTLRVLLEIQSFRHMDSDVDVSSRSTTPLHPLSRSITGSNKHLHSKPTDQTNNYCPAHTTIVRHPWFLPQRSADNQTLNGNHLKSPVAIKPKLPQNHLAIMTPLMERSMEGSSMFLDDNRNNEQEVDNLYDLFKRDHSNGTRDSFKEASEFEEEEDEDRSCYGTRKNKRIIYPCFSNKYGTDNADREAQFL